MFNIIDKDGNIIEQNLSALDAKNLATEYSADGHTDYRVVPVAGSEIGVVASTVFAKMARNAIRNARALEPAKALVDNDGEPVNNRFFWSSLMKQALTGRIDFSEKQLAFITKWDTLVSKSVEYCRANGIPFEQTDFETVNDLDWRV